LIRVLLALVAVVGGALFLACGGDDDATSTVTGTPTAVSTTAAATATPTKAATATPVPTPKATVNTDLGVTLREYEVTTDASSGPAGTFKFAIKNEGPAESHVFMIVKTDLAPNALPVTSTGQFAPNSDAVIQANTPVIGANASDSFSYALEAGKYVFICNNSDANGQGHYLKGMHVAFTVK
jgi:uncharacterized cupredoxin-like copper-binding protein